MTRLLDAASARAVFTAPPLRLDRAGMRAALSGLPRGSVVAAARLRTAPTPNDVRERVLHFSTGAAARLRAQPDRNRPIRRAVAGAGRALRGSRACRALRLCLPGQPPATHCHRQPPHTLPPPATTRHTLPPHTCHRQANHRRPSPSTASQPSAASEPAAATEPAAVAEPAAACRRRRATRAATSTPTPPRCAPLRRRASSRWRASHTRSRSAYTASGLARSTSCARRAKRRRRC